MRRWISSIVKVGVMMSSFAAIAKRSLTRIANWQFRIEH
jgi:hypothetical protein